jgi:hypothetical protein
VTFTAALAADLAVLSQALDAPDANLNETVGRTAASVRVAVPSYIGLTVVVPRPDGPFRFTLIEPLAGDVGRHGDGVRSSIMIAVPGTDTESADANVAVILYAGRAGAFVDLAADLSWMTGLALADFCLDEHLGVGAEPIYRELAGPLSVISQAIGVLIGSGHTPRQAEVELQRRAADAGTDSYGAAQLILDTLSAKGHRA